MYVQDNCITDEQSEHSVHVQEEERLHQAHQREEEALHHAHEQIEDELHTAHIREEEELHREHEREEHEREVHVDVTYNGLTKKLKVDLDAPAKVALEESLNLFGITQNRHTMSLYKVDGVEIMDDRSLRDQGVRKNALLLLRTSAVKGGQQ